MKRSFQLSSKQLLSFSLQTGESPVPPPSTVSSSALSTAAVAPPPQQKPGSSLHQDRKVPPPIGTERLARIRQTGSVNPPLLTTSYTASVGQGGIWSFGVGSASGESEVGLCICCTRIKTLFILTKYCICWCRGHVWLVPTPDKQPHDAPSAAGGAVGLLSAPANGAG